MKKTLKRSSRKPAAAIVNSGAAPSRSKQRHSDEPARPFPIVGLGASAGGLEAMTQLLRHLPANTGMAFVLVQHLDPTHESALASLLGRSTAMPTDEARNNMKLRPNHLYVIPPNKIMGISRRQLKLKPRQDGRETHTPIDHFLVSLANEESNSAIGVVLSGNGSDGTPGLQAIKAAGGITFAQEEKTAKYPAMPGSAITASCVDFVLSPERIARELARISGHRYIPKFRTLLEDILPQKSSFDGFEVTHRFPGVGQRTMRLNARQLVLDNTKHQFILTAIEDVTKK